MGCSGWCDDADAGGAFGAEKEPPHKQRNKAQVSLCAQLMLLEVSSSSLKADPKVKPFPLPQERESQ